MVMTFILQPYIVSIVIIIHILQMRKLKRRELSNLFKIYIYM